MGSVLFWGRRLQFILLVCNYSSSHWNFKGEWLMGGGGGDDKEGGGWEGEMERADGGGVDVW